jgi:arylsulfatase A-like enzyme
VPIPASIREAARSLLGGVVWIGTMYGLELWESASRLKRSAKKVRTDDTALRLAKEAAEQYLVGATLAYAMMAVLAGIVLHLALRIWFPREPGWKRWWAAAVAFALTATVAFFSHDAVLFPQRYFYYDGIEAYADLAHPTKLLVGWSALAIGLTAFAAIRRHTAETRKRLLSSLAGLAALGVGFGIATHDPREAPAQDNDGPNVIILGIDGLRPDHLKSFGYERDTAPNIDAFLEDAVVFESSWTVFARTYPSWTSILSGRTPQSHGIRDNLPQPHLLVPEGSALLPQVLQEQGYHTTWLTDDSRFAYMVPRTGFTDINQPPVGIQNFALSANEPFFRLLGGLLYNRLGFAFVPVYAHNQAMGRTFRPDDFVEHASNLMRRASRHEKFLYVVHSCVLHSPGDRPWPWHQMYDQAGFRGPNRFKYARAGSTVAGKADMKGLTEEVLAEQDHKLYDAGLDMADRMVGQLMADLEEGGLLDNSIVILLSDHGEEGWEPDLPYEYYGPNHGYHVFGDNQHRTLLAIRYPDGMGAGTRVADPVRTIDIMPTLAEQLGLDWPNEMDGHSMGNLIAGEHDAEPRPLYVETGMTERRYWNAGHADYPWEGVGRKYRVDAETGWVHVRPEFHEFLLGAKDRAYQQGDWKLVWRPMTRGPALVQLFNRVEDPVNRHDVSIKHPDELARLGLEMAAILARDGVGEPRALEWAERLGVTLDPEVAQLAEDAKALHARQNANKGRQDPDDTALAPKDAAAQAGAMVLPGGMAAPRPISIGEAPPALPGGTVPVRQRPDLRRPVLKAPPGE